MRRPSSVEGESLGGELGRLCENHPLRAAKYRVAIPTPPGYFKLSVLCQTCMREALEKKGVVVHVGRR